MGAEILTAAFVVVVIGGLGSFWGVIAAAMLVAAGLFPVALEQWRGFAWAEVLRNAASSPRRRGPSGVA